jgi:tetratricopeptide (TPR) repeat protein
MAATDNRNPTTGRRAAPPAGGPRKRKPSAETQEGARWIWLFGILALTFVVYQPSLDNDFTNWDDSEYVNTQRLLAHPNLHDILTTPVLGNYHPVTMLSLALNYQISLLRPASFHSLSLLLHLANTALTFLFIRKLVGGGLWAPVVTSLFFGIHPMHVESVAWIAERKDVLYTFFYLIGLLTYLRYLDTKRWVWMIPTLVAFVLSVGSKPAAVVFPITLLAIDWYRRRPWNITAILEKAPFFVVSLGGGLLTLHAQKIAGAVFELPLWSPFRKVLLTSCSTVVYVWKLFVPTGLSALYPKPNPNVKQLGAEFYLSFFALLVVLPAIAFLFRRNRAVLFGLMFFFINIVLVLHFYTFGVALIADRYTYLPYTGLFFALSYWMDPSGPSRADHPVKNLVAGVLLLLVPVCLYQTWKRCDVWQNSETLWNDTIKKYPHQIDVAYYLRGYYYHHTAGRPEAALLDYNETLAINPRYAFAWANKGALFADLNNPDSAFVCLNLAIQLKPDLAFALSNRGALKGQRGDLAGAIADFTRAIASEPEYRDPYENRAVAYYMLQQYESSITDSRRAVALEPENPDNHELRDAIGSCLQALGHYREAWAEHDAAIRTAPYGDPRIPGYYLNRSYAWWGLGDRAQALKDAQEAQRRGAPVRPEYLKKLGG